MTKPTGAPARPLAATGTTDTDERLSGSLGTGAIVFMVIAAAAPLTVIGGNAPLAIGQGNGAGAPVGFVIASLVLLLFSVGFVAMTPQVKEAGAFFSYVTLGLGRRLGMGTAYVALVAYTAIQAGIYGYMGWAVDDLVRHYGGPALPWWLYALLTLAVVAVLGYRHIELSSKVLGIALVLEMVVMLIVDVAVFANGGPEGVSAAAFEADTVLSGAIGVAILFALTGFIGFESTAIFRDEARQPERTIPRATYLAVTIVGVFYAISVWALIVAAGPSNAMSVARETLFGTGNMLLDTAGAYAGGFVREVMQVLLVTSLFACVLSFHNVIARYQFTLARVGSMPAPLGRVHPRHRSPARSSLVQTITAVVLILLCVLLGLDPLVEVFGYLAGAATIGMMIMLLLTTLAVIRYFANRPDGRTWRTRIIPVLALLAILGSAWLVVSNFSLITGGTNETSIFVACIPPLALLAGTIVGRREVARPTAVVDD